MRSWAIRHPIVAGVVGGLVWGIAIRAWMRFISTDPEFTWSGTAYIVGASTTVGLMLGLAWRRWWLARGNWWRAYGLSVLLLGVAAGGIMIPSVLVGAIGWGRSNWRRWLRVGLIGAALALQVWLVARDFRAVRRLLATIAYLLLLGLEAWAASIVFRPSRSAVPAADTPAPLPADAGG